MLNEGPEISIIILNIGLHTGHFILGSFKKEGFIIAMKFYYLG